MGCCISKRECSSDRVEHCFANSAFARRNKPLVVDVEIWYSTTPVTEDRLVAKRNEFWDTAPAFEGVKEIWDALRASVEAVEQNDHALAQGVLSEAFDELGNCYKIPQYCISRPSNLITGLESRPGSTAAAATNYQRCDGDSTARSVNSGSASPRYADGRVSSSTAVRASDSRTTAEATTAGDRTLSVKLRLDCLASEDLCLRVPSAERIFDAKIRLQHLHPLLVPSSQLQRWYFGGQLLQNESTIEECGIHDDYVVQVVLTGDNNTSLEAKQPCADHLSPNSNPNGSTTETICVVASAMPAELNDGRNCFGCEITGASDKHTQYRSSMPTPIGD